LVLLGAVESFQCAYEYPARAVSLQLKITFEYHRIYAANEHTTAALWWIY